MHYSFRSIGLFFGVFAVAYGGFFYQSYIASQNFTENTYETETNGELFKNTNKSVSISSDTEYKTERFSYDNSSDTNRSDLNDADTHLSHVDQSTSANTGIVDNTSHDNTDFDYGTKYNNYPATTGYTRNNSAPVSTSYSNGAQQSPSKNNNSLESTPDNASSPSGTNTTVTQTNDENTLDTDDQFINSIDQPIEDPWPTPNCPPQLAQGSTKDDAIQMQQSYGCRYLEYCQALNDGNGGIHCWYGFYSSN